MEHEWGSLMSRDNYVNILRKQPAVRALCLDNYLTGNANTRLMTAIIFYYYRGLGTEPTYHIANAVACATAEFLMPDVETLKMATTAAEILDGLGQLIEGTAQDFYELISVYTTKTLEEFLAWRALVPEEQSFQFPRVNNRDAIVCEHQLHLFQCMVRHLTVDSASNQARSLVVMSLAISVVAFCKKRLVENTPFCMKFVEAIKQEVGVQLPASWVRSCNSLIAEVVPLYVARGTLREVYGKMLADLPEMAVKLRTCLTNAGGIGMSTALVIREAIRKNPHFNWTVISQLFPEEFAAVDAAIRAVIADPFIGLMEQNAHPASRYKSVAYVAKKILIDVNGVSTLNGMVGIPNVVAYKTQIDLLVATYATRRAEQEINNETPAMVGAQAGLAGALVAACVAQQG